MQPHSAVLFAFIFFLTAEEGESRFGIGFKRLFSKDSAQPALDVLGTIGELIRTDVEQKESTVITATSPANELLDVQNDIRDTGAEQEAFQKTFDHVELGTIITVDVSSVGNFHISIQPETGEDVVLIRMNFNTNEKQIKLTSKLDGYWESGDSRMFPLRSLMALRIVILVEERGFLITIGGWHAFFYHRHSFQLGEVVSCSKNVVRNIDITHPTTEDYGNEDDVET